MELKTLYPHEIVERRNQLIKRIAEVAIKLNSQKECSKLGNCTYVTDNLKAVNFNVPQANGYLTLVCEKYPGVCELNMGERN
jgi:hypothetical protein